MAPRVASRSGSECLHGLLTNLLVGGGHERALAPLLVLLLGGIVGGAFVGVPVPFHLALEAVEDRSDHLCARGIAGGDVEELLGGLWALASLLVLLLARMVGGTFASVLVPLCLVLKVVEDCSDYLLARGIAGGDVEELLSSSWALMS